MKRSKDEILGQILESCIEEALPKTKIVYQSNLNFKTVIPYLDLLTTSGLLEIFGGVPNRYKTTQKGLEFLKHSNAIRSLLNSKLADNSN